MACGTLGVLGGGDGYGSECAYGGVGGVGGVGEKVGEKVTAKETRVLARAVVERMWGPGQRYVLTARLNDWNLTHCCAYREMGGLAVMKRPLVKWVCGLIGDLDQGWLAQWNMDIVIEKIMENRNEWKKILSLNKDWHGDVLHRVHIDTECMIATTAQGQEGFVAIERFLAAYGFVKTHTCGNRNRRHGSRVVNMWVYDFGKQKSNRKG